MEIAETAIRSRRFARPEHRDLSVRWVLKVFRAQPDRKDLRDREAHRDRRAHKARRARPVQPVLRAHRGFRAFPAYPVRLAQPAQQSFPLMRPAVPPER